MGFNTQVLKTLTVHFVAGQGQELFELNKFDSSRTTLFIKLFYIQLFDVITLNVREQIQNAISAIRFSQADKLLQDFFSFCWI
jgi:hypothetical protein